jgi:cytochrome bd-type quinol oxidase subunit 2
MSANVYDPAFWSRFQFAFTLTYHYLFPQLTMGLAWFLVYWKWRALRTGDEKYNQAVRFWAKIFGLNFAVGVVTGIPMEFQFGNIASIITLISGLSTRREMRAFVGSNFLLVGLLATGSAAIFPVMLHSTLAPENSVTAYAVASGPSALRLASIWWPVGFALAATYFVFISRRYAGKVSVQRDTQGFY